MPNLRSDSVTIVYPPRCKEISDDLGSDELIRRLKDLVHTFQNFEQRSDDSEEYDEFRPLALHLGDEYYLNHESRDVQLLVGCCIADILRIFAPDAPYKEPSNIKAIFMFIIKQLGGLKDPKDPAFNRYFYLLENLSHVKSFNMCFDLVDSSEIFCSLFSLLFRVINDEHGAKVRNFMLEILHPLITDADFVSKELLDIILKHVVEPIKSQRKHAYGLAKALILKTSDTLQPYLQQFFNQALILGKVEEKLTAGRKVYDLIYELNVISPSVLLSIIPQLDFKLKSNDEVERMKSVTLLARMFSEKSSRLASQNPQLWKSFLGRYKDVSLAIRTKCVQSTVHFLVNHEELLEDVIETLKTRQHDTVETVRFEVVMSIVTAIKRNFSVVANNETLLQIVKERTMDKKFKIRREAVNGLAHIYNLYTVDADCRASLSKDTIRWIRDKILHGYYMPCIDDRLLVERLLNTRLVPYSLPSEARMKKLYQLFATIDENATKAFIEIQKHQLNARKGVSEFIALHRLPQSEKNERDITLRIHIISKFLPNALKGQEFIKKLSKHLISEPGLLETYEKILDTEISCSVRMEAVNKALKKLGSPIMTNLYYSTIRSLLERASSLMIDGEALSKLADLVKEVLSNGDIIKELEVDKHDAGERGLRLLFVLSSTFPSYFIDKDLFATLLSFFKFEDEFVAPMILSILANVGKHKPLVDAFPEFQDDLVRICKEYIRRGNTKEAKRAIKCLNMNLSETKEIVFNEILDIIKSNMDITKGHVYRTAIVALGHIAFHLPELYPIQIKNIVSREIVRKLLMQDSTPARAGSDLWDEEENLPLETLCKIEGMKMMARWLLGLKNEAIPAQKTFRMLNAIVENGGDLLEKSAPNPAEKAWLRLSAGCAMLKICEQMGTSSECVLDHFYNMCKLLVDEVPQVREKFLIKLHKGLGKGIPNKCLSLNFMGMYALAGMESDKKIKAMAKQFLATDITKRRECIKTLSVSGSVNENSSSFITKICPDYIIAYAIPILAHHPKYKTYDDSEMLTEIQKALWFILEPLVTKTDTYSFYFYKTVIESIKNMFDITKPDDDDTNFRLWATCDLAMSLIISRTVSYELKDWSADIRIPSNFFKSSDDPTWVNVKVYVPESMRAKIPKKTISTGPPSKRRKPNEDSDKTVSNDEHDLLNEAPAETINESTQNGSNISDDLEELAENINEEPVTTTLEVPSANGRPKRSTRKQ